MHSRQYGLITNSINLAPDSILFDKFRVVKLLGRGGMGSVYQVQHMHLRTEYALKCLNIQQQNDANWRRFENEARAANMLDHPNLIKVHDSGLLPDGQPYFVMDLINGVTLGDEIKKTGTLPVPIVLKVFIQVGFALSYAHERGVIHRDIKPSNIMLVKNDDGTLSNSVKVVDFGIAKLTGQDEFSQQSLTKTGEIFGSPLYMSPEQCMGVTVDHRCDLYSFGCVMYEALTGAPPMVGDSALATMMKHQSAEPLSLKQASMGIEYSEQLEALVRKLLEKEPQDRYANASLLTADLVAIEQSMHTGVAMALNIEQSGRKIGAKPQTVVADKRFAALTLTAIVAAYGLGIGTGMQIKRQNQSFEPQKIVELEDNADAIPAIKYNGKALEISDSGHRDVIPLPERAMQAAQKSQLDEIASDTIKSAPPPLKVRKISYDAKYFSDQTGSVRKFHFPKDVSLGEVDSASRVNDDKRDMQGDKLLGVPLALTVNDMMIANPHLFSKFRPDEPLNLFFNPTERSIEPLLLQASKFDALYRLDLEKTPVDASIVKVLERFHGLTFLSVARTKLKGMDLVNFKLLSKLNFLSICGLANVSPLIKKIAKECNLKRFEAGDCDLSINDLKTIAAIKGLKFLDLTGNESVNDDTLTIFLNAPNLETLDLERCDITAKSIPIFKKMKNMKALRLTKPLFDDQGLEDQFEKELPSLEINWRYGAPQLWRKNHHSSNSSK
jgi:serine/threonine protein kinase